MIQANELRIGNYIHNEVQGINFKVCNVVISRLYFGDSEGYKPIELTEEILLKCKGILKQESKVLTSNYVLPLRRNKCLIITDIGTPNFMIGIADLDFENKCKIDDLVNIWNWDFDKEIQLHHFQNIVHDLSGKELEINF